jgi:hypothetical protein
MVNVLVQRTEGGWLCDVSVEEGGERSRHAVVVSAADAQRWGGGDEPAEVEDLVRRSFEFLLEREPPGSILREFDLSVIQRYFPEYEARIKR